MPSIPSALIGRPHPLLVVGVRGSHPTTIKGWGIPATLAILLLAFAPAARAESVDFSPGALTKLRSETVVKATHAALTELENDVNHLAVLSEMCRAESGAQA